MWRRLRPIQVLGQFITVFRKRFQKPLARGAVPMFESNGPGKFGGGREPAARFKGYPCDGAGTRTGHGEAILRLSSGKRKKVQNGTKGKKNEKSDWLPAPFRDHYIGIGSVSPLR